nr:photochlorophyllide reductase subunit B [Lycium barbarum]
MWDPNSRFSLGGIGKDLEWNNIDSYRRKGSLLIQTLYLWDRDRGRGKTEDFTWYFYQSDLFRTFRSMRKWVKFYRIKPMGLKE